MLPPLVKLGVNVLFITFELRIIVSGSSASEFELIVILTFVVKCSDQAVLHHYVFFCMIICLLAIFTVVEMWAVQSSRASSWFSGDTMIQVLIPSLIWNRVLSS
jgi:hypothetical protein